MLSARRCCYKARDTLCHGSSYHAAFSTSQNENGLNAFVNAAKTANVSPYHEDTAGSGGSLKGKSIAIKDNIVTKDLPTTAASKMLSNYTSPFDATVVKLLRQDGATISSKANLDEFGMGSHSQNAHSGAVQSPFSHGGVALSPGGSSGGSAVAVARGDCWAALGTDTGGSVRLPAAYTGVVGFKPSYGLLSRWGVIQYANSLDTVGILARQVDDARTVFNVVNIFDAQDPTSLPPSKRKSGKASRDGKQGKTLRIGIPHEYNVAELTPAVRQTWTLTLQHLQNQGHSLVPVSLPRTKQALSAYYVLAPAEASSNLAKYDGIRYGWRPSAGRDSSPADKLPLYARTRGEAFGEEVKRRILLGAYTLSSEAVDNYFIQAQKIRRLVQRDFDLVFAQPNPLVDRDDLHGQQGQVDVLITPTAPTLPPTGEEVKAQTSVESYMNDVFTVPASLAGLPATSVPVRLPESVREGMEESDVNFAGLQIIGQFGDDELVLRAAEIVEGLS